MIASELREWTVEKFEHLRLNKEAYNELSDIADNIDEKYEETRLFCSRLEEAAADHEDVTLFDVDYIPLPLDANGEYIHIGDMMWQRDRITKRSCKAIMGSEYVMLDGIQGAVYAKKLTHYHKPTVEKLLEEMYDALNDRFMKLPTDSEGQLVNPGDSVIVDLCDGEYSGKVMGVCRYNRIVVDMPRWNVSHGYDIYHPQSMNAHYVRQNPYWEEA